VKLVVIKNMFKVDVNLRYQINSEVIISHETTTMVVWIYDGI